MSKFWLDDFQELFNIENFRFNNLTSAVNVITLIIIIASIYLTIKRKDMYYFGVGIIILNILIIIHTNISKMKSSFSNISETIISDVEIAKNSSNFDQNSNVNIYSKDIIDLMKDTVPVNGIYNKLIVSSLGTIFPGDSIYIFDKATNSSEINIVDVAQTSDTESYFIVKSPLQYAYKANQTKISLYKSSKPMISEPPDPLASIQKDNNNPVILGMDQSLADLNIPKGDFNKKDYKLFSNTSFQGPPNGSLRCKFPSQNNPMGVLGIEDYDEQQSTYGTCNYSSNDGRNSKGDVNPSMDDFLENGVSQRINDILFHRGNSQNRFMPMPVDTVPNLQDQFATFCYINPSNVINPKYASIFVNDPEKFKLVTRLANATGTENGG